MRRHLRFWLLLFFLLLTTAHARAQPWTVVLVSSERGAAYQEAARAIAGELERGGIPAPSIGQLTAAELAATEPLTPRLFIALGTEASMALARNDTKAPVLSTLLPRLSFERVLRDSGRRVSPQFSALYLNQPLSRQLDLIRLALPQARRIGILFSEETRAQEAGLETVARDRGLSLVSAHVRPDEPVFNGVQKIVSGVDLLLALADPRIYNSNTLPNILLTSFRAQVPMLAFSPAYVRAGALLAIYSTPTQIGQQAGAMAREVLLGKPLGAPQYPQEFTIQINEHVARSLNLNLEPKTLMERLRQQEKKP